MLHLQPPVLCNPFATPTSIIFTTCHKHRGLCAWGQNDQQILVMVVVFRMDKTGAVLYKMKLTSDWKKEYTGRIVYCQTFTKPSVEEVSKHSPLGCIASEHTTPSCACTRCTTAASTSSQYTTQPAGGGRNVITRDVQRHRDVSPVCDVQYIQSLPCTPSPPQSHTIFRCCKHICITGHVGTLESGICMLMTCDVVDEWVVVYMVFTMLV